MGSEMRTGRRKGFFIFFLHILRDFADTRKKCKGVKRLKEIVVYLKCSLNVEVQCEDVFLKDVASVECEDAAVLARCRAMKVYRFHGEQKRTVISSLKLIQLICRECPGVLVQSVGESDVLIEKVKVDKKNGFKVWSKIVVVSLVCFFGTASTLVAYNSDVAVRDIFEEVYEVFMDKPPGPVNVLELTYSIGLALGITLFYNHIGRRRITSDPTPIEVSMRNYERDVNQALIETADREGLEEDV